MFDGIAPRYDFLNHFLSAGLDRGWRTNAIRTLRLAPDARVLDLCTGTADMAMAAAAAAAHARVIGVDFAPAMLRIGVRKVCDAHLSDRVTLVHGDATRVPVRDGWADAATIGFGIRNVAEPQRTLAELARVLKRGGRLAIVELGQPIVPGIRQVYSWYFHTVLPRLGRLVSKHASAYSYLPASVGTFMPPAQFAAMISSHGFHDVTAVPLSLGIVYLYAGTRT